MRSTTELVTVYLGEKEREFTVEVEAWYDGGDYYTPPDSGMEIVSDVYDENNNNANELVERYERMFKVDFETLAFDSFESLF